jgi:hypothetical protein
MIHKRRPSETRAGWLNRLVDDGIVTVQAIHTVLGVNPARIYEWMRGSTDFPHDASDSLTKWLDDGRPQFDYWIQDV